jgi:hypothetical protein
MRIPSPQKINKITELDQRWQDSVHSGESFDLNKLRGVGGFSREIASLRRVLAHDNLEGMGWGSKEVGEIESLLEVCRPAPIT